jgi:hypothetical protein
VAPLLGTFERYAKRALEMQYLSLCRGSIKGNLEGGFFSGDTEKHVTEASGRGASLSYGGSVRGTLREASHTEDLYRRIPEGSGSGSFLFAGAP